MVPRRDADRPQRPGHGNQGRAGGNGTSNQQTQTDNHSQYSTLSCAASMQRAAVDLLGEVLVEREAACRPVRELVLLLPAMRYICEVLAAHAARERGAA